MYPYDPPWKTIHWCPSTSTVVASIEKPKAVLLMISPLFLTAVCGLSDWGLLDVSVPGSTHWLSRSDVNRSRKGFFI